MAGRQLEVGQSSTTISWVPILAAALSVAGIILAFVAHFQDDFMILGIAGILELMAVVWAVLGLLEDR